MEFGDPPPATPLARLHENATTRRADRKPDSASGEGRAGMDGTNEARGASLGVRWFLVLDLSGFRVYKDLSSHPSRKSSGGRPPTMYNPPRTRSRFERNARELRPHRSCVSRRYRRLFRLRLRHVCRPARYEVRIHEVPQRLPLARQHDESHALRQDRKSTRLNSSHTVISYAVFCLKKKKKTTKHATWSKTEDSHASYARHHCAYTVVT